MSAVLILSTAPTHEEASQIAETLVAERLAACVQLSPIQSWYRWHDKIESVSETKLHIKTSSTLAAQVEQRIRALHSYDIPEIIIIAITGGSTDYFRWLSQSVETQAQ